ncbi:MAG: hypothetical protein IT373_27055 [Polyangiaceae bacterium]|nr:hypothetical protein [Polyangiaceae bacterium]
MPFVGTRNVYFVVPSSRDRPQRLLAMLHGLCNPPAYACGLWARAASERGFLVCPSGDGSCGPAAYDAPTWTEPFDKMAADLDLAVATVEARYPGEIRREGGILAGFSRGAYAAPEVVERSPGRYRYLLLVEADVQLSAARLRAAGVRAVALLAGELGTQHRGEARTAAALAAGGLPARFWPMRGAGHWYSEDIDALMREATGWLLSHEGEGDER